MANVSIGQPMAQDSHTRRQGAKCGDDSNTSTPSPSIPSTSNNATSSVETDRPFMVAGMRRYLNTDEASIYLDCTTRTIFRMVKQGRLRGFHLGRSLKFRPEDLDKVMEQKSSAPATADDLDDFIAQQKPRTP